MTTISGTQQEYELLYKQLLSEQGRQEIGDDPLRQEKALDKIQKFLDTYPQSILTDKNASTPVMKLSLHELFKRCLQTAIDVLNDLSELITHKDTLGSTMFRRKVIQTFTEPQRRFYVGIWLVVLSFIVYFIDSAA